MNIYVSNLGFGVETENLEKIFAPYGEVTSVKIITDKVTNRSRGYGFIQMTDREAGEKAIRELSGSMLEGRSLKLNEAREREEVKKRTSFY